jgi:hypothetical protein
MGGREAEPEKPASMAQHKFYSKNYREPMGRPEHVLEFIFPTEQHARQFAAATKSKGSQIDGKFTVHLDGIDSDNDAAEARYDARKFGGHEVHVHPAASMAIPVALVAGVYVIEGIAAVLTAAAAIRQLRSEGVQAKVVPGKRILARGPRKKIERVAEQAGGTVREAKKAASMSGGKKYPWDECVSDQTRKYGAKAARRVCGAIKRDRGAAQMALTGIRVTAYFAFHKKEQADRFMQLARQLRVRTTPQRHEEGASDQGSVYVRCEVRSTEEMDELQENARTLGGWRTQEYAVKKMSAPMLEKALPGHVAGTEVL